MLRSTLSFIAGAAVATLLWIVLTPQYNALLATTASSIVRLDPRFRDLDVVTSGRRILARGGESRSDVPGIVIAADQLTYNIILLCGLFATNRAPLRDRGALRFAVALLVLFATHVLAIAIAIEATYATKTGAWGAAAYGDVARNLWSAIEYGYRLFGMFAIAFGLWWTTRVSGASEVRRSRG